MIMREQQYLTRKYLWITIDLTKHSFGSAAANIDRYIKSILGLLQGRVRVGLG